MVLVCPLYGHASVFFYPWTAMWRCEDNSRGLLSHGPASLGLKILYMVDRVVQYMVRSLGQAHTFIPEAAIWQTVMRGLVPFQCSARAWNSLEVKNYYLHFSEWPSGRGSAHSKAGCGALGRGSPHGRKTWPCLTVEKRRLPVPVWQLCWVSSRSLLFPDPGSVLSAPDRAGLLWAPSASISASPHPLRTAHCLA